MYTAIVTSLLVALGLVVRIGLKARNIFDSPKVNFNDETCELVGEDVLVGSEDLALGRKGVLFIASGDLKKTFQEGSASAIPGNIFALDMHGSFEAPVQVPLENFPSNVRFQPHGIHVSNSSDHLLTINHAGDHSRVEVFQIEYHPQCMESRPWSCPPATLHHLNSLTSDLFPNYGINDVVEGTSHHELYVTQWLTLPYPEHGLKSDSDFKRISPLLLYLIGFPWTRVYHCSWSEDVFGGDCEPVTGRIFYGANGITISEDKKQLFINDVIDKKITIMDIQDDGKLVETGHIDLLWFVDNIEMEGEEIIMGTIVDLRKVIESRDDPSVDVPGGMLVVRKEGGVWKVDQEHVLAHNGSKLSQISAAARWGTKVVLGSPYSRGVLVCQ